MRISTLPILTLALILASPAPAAPPEAADNPFFAASTLPFQAPPFDRIQERHYAPALEEGMQRQLAEIEAISTDSAAPTFANTIEAAERTGQLLTRVSTVFFALSQSNTSDGIEKIKAEFAPKLAAHADAIYMNPRLFARVKTLYDARDTLQLDPESRFLLERYWRNFVRAGARLGEADQAQLRALNQEESKLSTEFEKRLLADTNASAVIVESRAELAGLSEGDISAAAEAAKERGLAGKWVLSLQNTTQQPALSTLANRQLRERVFRASTARGNHGGPNDTKEIATRLAKLRAQRARLLGFADYASFTLDDQMAKTPQNAAKLLTDLVPAAAARAREEAAAMQRQIDSGPERFPLGPADWEFYSEKVRMAEFDLDESQLRPYLALDRVLEDGVFFAATQLYGITFVERKDLPVYHPDVRVWEVREADGKPLALYYGDYYARSSKGGGAWCSSFVDQSRLMGTRPVVFNVTNYAKPAPGQPALLSFDNVNTLFHEFGHALHAMFSDIRYPTLGNTPRDFVEFPSQINEHWALEPTVLARYAKHHETGQPMPAALVEKIRKSRTFNQGYKTTEYLAAALLDMAWHQLPADAPAQEVNAFEPAALARFKVDLPEVPPRYRTTYFAHIWEGGYAAGYYAYLWSEVLDCDSYAWFRENGGMTRANGDRFRAMILSRGGTADVASLFRAFRGREPSVEPLLEERGLKPATATATAKTPTLSTPASAPSAR